MSTRNGCLYPEHVNADYVYADHADVAELARLQLLEAESDPHTNDLFDRIGVMPGWRCLEVGAGAGSIARLLASRVGPSGHVVAIDADPRFLDSSRSRNLEVRRADILTDDVEPGMFDLVHARHLLAHVGGRAAEAVDRMVGALRPGGWIVVEDIDLSGILILNGNPLEQAAADSVLKAVRRLIVDRGGDPRIGMRLPGLFEDAGLVDIAVEAHLPFVRGDGSPPLALTTLRALGPQLINTGVARRVLDTLLDALAEPSYRGFDPARIAVCGRRPRSTDARGQRPEALSIVRGERSYRLTP